MRAEEGRWQGASALRLNLEIRELDRFESKAPDQKAGRPLHTPAPTTTMHASVLPVCEKGRSDTSGPRTVAAGDCSIAGGADTRHTASMGGEDGEFREQFVSRWRRVERLARSRTMHARVGKRVELGHAAGYYVLFLTTVDMKPSCQMAAQRAATPRRIGLACSRHHPAQGSRRRKPLQKEVVAAGWQ